MAKSYCEHSRIRGNCAVCSSEAVLNQYRYKAHKREISFSLTLPEFETLTETACTFCGETPSGGVDRKDSRLGYYFQNSQPCCGFCNRLKSDLIQDRFLQQVQKIAAHQEKLRKQKLVAPQVAA